eukprot:jgi/Phyca11/17491/fgenesh1_pg.PHYCAscaffold_28_\
MYVAEGGRDVATRGQNDLAKTVRRLTRDLRDLERQVGELQAERSRLQAEVASLLQDPETTQAHAAQIAALQDRVGRRDMEIADMARAEDVLRRDLGVLVAEREDLAAQVSIANDEVDRLQAEVGAAKIEIEELQYTLRLTEGSLAYAQRSVDHGQSGSAPLGLSPTPVFWIKFVRNGSLLDLSVTRRVRHWTSLLTSWPRSDQSWTQFGRSMLRFYKNLQPLAQIMTPLFASGIPP